ncbi:MAG: hypothetical protein JJE22_13640 [Bacteroidia bacterium]|nr:hypothetical protein [Bacteroidia bacterium]
MKQFLFLSSILISCAIRAQDINGTWKGKLIMDPGGCFPVYNIELQLQVVGSRISGVSYHFSDTTNYVKESFEGSYEPGNISINEIGVTTFHIPAECIPCIKKYLLTYHKGGNEEQLRGTWSGKTMDNKMNCPPGTIVLTRFDKSTFKPEARLPATLTQRKADLVREIKVDTGTIKLDFYDNGQIDGDTISVYVNNIAVVINQRLTTRPISVKIKIDLNQPQQEVIMVGENLGSIPPNTALMIVNAGEKRYQLYLTSDEQKNAMVRFIYEKPVAVLKKP